MFPPPDSTHHPGCPPRPGVHGSALGQGRPFGPPQREPGSRSRRPHGCDLVPSPLRPFIERTVDLEGRASSIGSPIPHRMVPRLSRSLLWSSSSDSPYSFTRHASIATAITGCWLPGYPPKVGRKLRYQVIALGREQGSVEKSPSGPLDAPSVAGSSGDAAGRRRSSRWAALVARIYDVLPLVCPGHRAKRGRGASMRIIAFVTDPVPVRSILSYLDLPTRPPPLSPARAPPQGLFAFDQTGGFDPADPEPIPEFEFDQSISRGLTET